MRIPLASFLAVGLLVAPGCGPASPPSNLLGAASHGGVTFGFLDKTGSVEIGSEPADSSSAGVSKQNSHQVFAYFYQADGVTPLPTRPADVKIVRGTLPPIPLTPLDLPGKTGRFASAPAPQVEDLRGTLELTIEGRKVEVPFARR